MKLNPLRLVWAVALLAACDSGASTALDIPDALAGDATPMPADGSTARSDALATDAAATDASTDAVPAATTDGRTPMDSLDPDSAPPDASLEDPTAAVFDTSHVLEVEVLMAPADWDALRVQGRNGLDTRGADCLGAPFASPYTWFSGQVTLDGQRYEDVGVRKKGFIGSLSDSKPSLVLDLDHNVADQAHQTLSRFALNNARQDPSLIRTCLAYEVMAGAGVAAPRCAFAHVTVNGADLGVYAHVESIRKPFLRRHFADDSGHLYEGTLSDFRAGWSGTLDQKTDEEVPYRAPIDRLIAAAAEPDEGLISALEAVLDLDGFLRFWAAEVLVSHWDGYAGDTNNYWIYDDPTTGKIAFLPWGTDATFEPPRLLFEGLFANPSVMATGILARRLYLHPEGRRRYLETLRVLIDEHFDAEALVARADTFAFLITSRLPAGERRAHGRAVSGVKAFIEAQGALIRAELDAGGVDWNIPLRGSLCTEPGGHLTGGFATTWGSWPAADPFAVGTGALSGTIRGADIPVEMAASAAGVADGGAPILLVPARLVGGTLVYVFIEFRAGQLAPGVLSMEDVAGCTYNHFDPETSASTTLADCPEGSLTFDAAEFRAGAPIEGSFDLELWVGVE